MTRKLGWLMLALLLASPVALYLALIDDRPFAPIPGAPAPNDALRAKALARAIVTALDSDVPTTIVVSAGDLNSLAILAARGMPGFAGEATMSANGIEARASIPLPRRLAGRFVNATVTVLPSERGLRIAQCQIGALQLPGDLSVWVAEHLANLVLGNDLGTRLLESIDRVQVTSDAARIEIDPSGNFRAALDALRERFGAVRDLIQPAGDPRRIGIYYDRIVDLEHALGYSQSRSLALYVGNLFALAQARSASGDPVLENESLIYALAAYFASYRFGTLTGIERANATPDPSPRSEPLLGRRRDLRLHFLVSAGIELLSNHDLSIAAGEFKELLDTGQGGSGFSFSDLAADRAGVLFARLATGGYLPARELQRRLAANPEEAAFFPDIGGLRDGIPKTTFEREFGGLDSEPYRRVVAEIDARIERLPAYHELLRFLAPTG